MAQQSKSDLTGNNKACTIFDRDRKMLEFLWRHRVANFKTLYTLFYKNIHIRTCYNRLSQLRHKGFIKTCGVDGTQNRFWVLDKRGMSYLIQVNGEIYKSKGFAPQSIIHDHFSSCVLLGDWLTQLPKGVSLITEQELLALDLSLVVPHLQCDKNRRPDGLWLFEIGQEKKILALEVELHAKNENDYTEIVRSYDSYYNIHKIIWVVDGASLLKKIFSVVQKHSTLKTNDHLFMLASEVKTDLWQAKFKNDKFREITLKNYLKSFLSESEKASVDSLMYTLSNTPSTAQVQYMKNVLFDFSSCREKSSTYRKIEGLIKT